MVKDILLMKMVVNGKDNLGKENMNLNNKNN